MKPTAAVAFGTVYAKNSSQSYKDWSVLDKNLNYMIHRDQLFKEREKYLRMYYYSIYSHFYLGNIQRIEVVVQEMHPNMANPNLSLLMIKIQKILQRGTVEYSWNVTPWIKRLLMKGHTSKYSKDLGTSRNLSILSTTLAAITTLLVMTSVRSPNRNIATNIFNR